jgi:hypothetical protein
MWHYNVKLFSPKVDIIPGGVAGECRMVLRVFIGSKDSIDVRMFETLKYHELPLRFFQPTSPVSPAGPDAKI